LNLPTNDKKRLTKTEYKEKKRCFRKRKGKKIKEKRENMWKRLELTADTSKKPKDLKGERKKKTLFYRG